MSNADMIVSRESVAGSARGRVLLINPRITSRPRFPLSIMSLAAALEPDFASVLVDGNIDPTATATVRRLIESKSFDAVGITVMGGPQVETAIEISAAVREMNPELPIVWGGYFPTLYPDTAMNADYVDFLVRGQGEFAFRELLEALAGRDSNSLSGIAGVSWRHHGKPIHNADRAFTSKHVAPRLDYDRLPNASRYAVKSFLGNRTVAHQAALGCRFRCTFCGVAAMFRGATALPPADLLDRDIGFLKRELGADSIQFYDHNFFDREDDMVPVLEVLARHELPWWCYARSDALLNLSATTWKLIRKSQLRMAYIGAETPNDALLKSIRKGTRSEQTLEILDVCRGNSVIPELSFMVAPPENTEADTEDTFAFIREVKRRSPESELIVYINTPLPQASVPNADRLTLAPLSDSNGSPVEFPTTPEQWTEKRWVDYACHADAPWLTDRLRDRIRDFVTVLRCRFPTVQDTETPSWAKSALRGLASWRYATGRYDRPWELDATSRLIDLLDPRASGV